MITAGFDVGSRYVGWAVLDERLVEAGVWDLTARRPWLTAEAYLRELAWPLYYRHGVRLLAIETYHWQGRWTTHAKDILPLIGALRSLKTRRLQLAEYQPDDHMRELMGYLPHARLRGSHEWKRQVRVQVGLVLGYTWPAVKRSDPAAFHDSDAASLAWVARAHALHEAKIHASLRKER
jgi:hypothetical protein